MGCNNAYRFLLCIIWHSNISFNLSIHFIFTLVLDNFCENALDLSNDKLIVDSTKWQFGTYCQWLISAVDDKHYVILEFENIDVRIVELDYLLTRCYLSFYKLARGLAISRN